MAPILRFREEVGADNFFLFGLTAGQVQRLRASGYDPHHYYENDSDLREALDLLVSGLVSLGDKSLFRPLVDSLLQCDEYMLLADYRSYVYCQDHIGQIFLDQQRWTRMSLMNIAHSGRFSSDRTICEYCEDIWKTTSLM
jgi:glycogen phosphorylase